MIGNGCFAPGQLYTALSRVRTLAGLSLDREIKENDLFFAPEVIDFYNKICGEDKIDFSDIVTMDIPAAYAETVRKMLAELLDNEKISA